MSLFASRAQRSGRPLALGFDHANSLCSCFGKVKFPRGVIGEDGKQFVKGVSLIVLPRLGDDLRRGDQLC